MITTPPRLPPELIEEVIFQVWELQLSANERILLMTSLPLVSRYILDVYLRISSIHVHIPCPPYVERFLQTLRESGLRYSTIRPMRPAAELCRSITLEIVPPIPPNRALDWSAEPPMGVALSDLLYNLRLFGHLPNFRTLTIRYIDVDMNDIFDWVRFIDFPRTVEWLNLEFVQTRVDVPPPPKFVIIPPGYSSHDSLWTLPFLRHLRVSGGSKELISRLISAAPNLETVQHTT